MAEDVQTGAPEAPATPMTAPVDTAERVSTSEAARILASLRHKPRETQSEQQPAEAAPVDESPAQAEDAAPPQEVPGETQEADQADVPTIEPPRSWTKEAKERWQSLPHETQEYLAEREQERERELRRGQNEAAEKLKGLTAKEQALEQVRQQYESALPQVLQRLQASAAVEFADIKTTADRARLAAEDWPRYIQWTERQTQIAEAQQELKSAQDRQTHEHTQQWNDFAKKQDEEFLRAVPDMADSDKAAKIQKSAISLLTSIGFTEQELADSYHGKLGLSARDHRVQLLIRDAVSWREAQANAKNIVKKPVPPVQRPGVARPRGADAEAAYQANLKKLDTSSGINQIRAAAAALRARRTASR